MMVAIIQRRESETEVLRVAFWEGTLHGARIKRSVYVITCRQILVSSQAPPRAPMPIVPQANRAGQVRSVARWHLRAAARRALHPPAECTADAEGGTGRHRALAAQSDFGDAFGRAGVAPSAGRCMMDPS